MLSKFSLRYLRSTRIRINIETPFTFVYTPFTMVYTPFYTPLMSTHWPRRSRVTRPPPPDLCVVSNYYYSFLDGGRCRQVTQYEHELFANDAFTGPLLNRFTVGPWVQPEPEVDLACCSSL